MMLTRDKQCEIFGFAEKIQDFFYRYHQTQNMRSWIFPVCLCLFFFIIPLQVFVIGGGMGFGIQGAVYRYQITTNGVSFIPVTTELNYVTGGVITGKTAISIILWTLGTIMLSIAAAGSLVIGNRCTENHFKRLVQATALAGIFYLAALGTQYGILFNGPAGISMPIGILVLFMVIGSLYYYRQWFFLRPDERVNF
jgi:hypothetical protein